MKAGIAVVVALVGTLASCAAMAATNDGNALLTSCKPILSLINKEATKIIGSEAEAGECLGLTEGVRNTMMQLNSSLQPEMRTCFPDLGIQNGQAIRIVVKYLESHPEKLNQDRTLLTMLAYNQAYACK